MASDRGLDVFRQAVQAAARDVDQFRQGLRDAAREAQDSARGRSDGGPVVSASLTRASQGSGDGGAAGAIGGAIAGAAGGVEAAAVKAGLDELVALASVAVKTLLPGVVDAIKANKDAQGAQESTVGLAQEMAAFGMQASPQLLQENFDAELAANKRASAARTRVEGMFGAESSAMNAFR